MGGLLDRIACRMFGHDICFPTDIWQPLWCGRCGQQLSRPLEIEMDEAWKLEKEME